MSVVQKGRKFFCDLLDALKNSDVIMINARINLVIPEIKSIAFSIVKKHPAKFELCKDLAHDAISNMYVDYKKNSNKYASFNCVHFYNHTIKIAVNECLKFLRKSSTKNESPTDFGEGGFVVFNSINWPATIVMMIDKPIFLDSLTDQESKILYLLRDLTRKEVAVETGLSYARVSNICGDIINKYREVMQVKW